MRTMIKYEFKKILNRKSSKISLLILGIWMVGCLLFIVNSTSWVKEDGEHVYGLEAIKINKAEKSKWNGPLSQEVIESVISINKEIINNPEYQNEDGSLSNIGYAKTQGFQGIRSLIVRSFCSFSTYDYYIVDRLMPEQSHLFYSNRINGLNEWLEDERMGNYFSDKEKAFFVSSAVTLETPFTYSYMDGWENALNYTSMTLFINTIIICIILAPTFSMEYETGADAIFLSTKHGKNKAIKIKLFCAYTLATLIYWGSVLLFSGMILLMYGMDGADCIIQTNSYCWKSYYQLTNIEATWLLFGLGYIGSLLMVSLALWISAKLKTAFASIVLAFLVLIIPFMIETSSMPPVVEQIFDLMPHQTISGLQLIRLYRVYNILGILLTPPQVITILYLLICLILIPLTYRAFKKHQVK